MSVEKELREKIQRSGRVEPVKLLAPHASYFHRKAVEVIEVYEQDATSSWAFQAACQETTERLLPLVDFLTQPRSMREFQDLKRGLLEMIWVNDSDLREVVKWLPRLLPEIKVFPYLEIESFEFELKKSLDFDLEEFWQEFEVVGSRPFRRIKDKIISFNKAVELSEQLHTEDEGRVGYTAGKWRLGDHLEHRQLLEEAKLVLGADGLLVVGVESKRSIEKRRGKSHFVYDDEERLTSIAGLEAVDFAVLLDPSAEELENLNQFYYQVWQRLNPDIYFFGTADYHWRPEFERRAKELGVILLWRSPTARLSSTELIAQIRTAG